MMPSSPPSDDLDPRRVFALVGTDKLDGSELDNVRTGLTPPCRQTGFFEHEYRVEDISTPTRLDEDAEDGIFADLEVVPVHKEDVQGSMSLKVEQHHPSGEQTGSTSVQMSRICLDDILPIIDRERPRKPCEHVGQRGQQNDEEQRVTPPNHHQRGLRHSWDVATTTEIIIDPSSARRQSSSAGSLIKAKKKQFVCTEETCRRRFNRSDELGRHMRVHSGVRPYTCEFCQKRFARSDHLKTHRRTHTGERPFECEVCAKRFARSDEKTRHARTHSTGGKGLPRVSTAPELGGQPPTGSHGAIDGSISYRC